MSDDSFCCFTFEGFTLDLARGRLFNGSEEIFLRRKSLSCLIHLVRQAGRVMSKDELLAAIWPDVIVTEDSLTRCVHEVRRALGPDGDRILRTVPRRGYLLAAVVSQEPTGPQRAAPVSFVSPREAPPEGTDRLALRRDGIAVMPFVASASGEPKDGILLDGLVHDVISILARLRSFHVIARGSAFALRPLARDPQAAGRALGVAHTVCGMAVMRADHLCLRIELVRVEDGAVLWTDDLTERRENLVRLPGALAGRIAHRVEGEVTAAEARRAFATPELALDARGHYHLGLREAFRFEPDKTRRALARFREATRLDPAFARAHAAQSFCHYYFAFSGVAEDRAAEVLAARRTAAEALQADDANPSAHWAFGRALWLEGDPEGCLLHARRAVSLSPGFAHAHYTIGFIETHGGDARHGIEKMDLALSLSPFDPFTASFQITRAIALVRLGRVDEAADWACDAARQPNAYPALLAPASLILASAGRGDEARRVVGRIRSMAPDYSASHLFRSIYSMSGDVSELFRRTATVIGL